MPDHKDPHHRHVPSSAVASFIDAARIERLLAPWVPDPHDRTFVVRCILEEGPAHHRGANYVLLALLGRLLEAGGPVTAPADAPARPVPMRLPPHLARERGDEGFFPLAVPTGPLERLAAPGSRAFEAMLDCVTDGPPQHSLANAAMLCLIAVLLERLEGKGA